jgi:2-keto-4-pentenoate hydratase/2-oxohepta-3-ene-1,7-dioic acid hydratase in catechol pathway
MRLIRFGELRKERPGILASNGLRKDLSSYFPDWDSTFWDGDGPQRLTDILRTHGEDLPTIPEDARWGAPVPRPGKVICIGLNYSDHAAETGAAIPAEPILFMKASNTVVGPFDDIEIPRHSTKTDWEVELGVIIGRTARYLRDPEQAREHVAGYVLSHDVSEREFQLERGGQWTKGKSCDTFNPLGPFLLTADDLPNPGGLAMRLDVNGQRRQTGNTSTMVFDVFSLVHYISQFMTLEPGDLISTGTPPGVGLGMKPPQYLKPGDLVELAIEQLGSQRQHCIPAPG